MELLQKTVLFKGITPEKLGMVSGLFEERQIKPNTTVFTEKMPAESLYLVKSGSIRITIMAGEGEEVSLLVLGPGEFFGELALLQEESRLVSARSETTSELLLLSRKNFQKLMEFDPRTAASLLHSIAKLFAMRVKAYTALFRDLLLG